jgi:ATP-binding cassette subfamily C protein
MIGLGALLVLRDELSAGAMVAAAILAGRALAPIDTAIAQWPAADRALTAWKRLSRLLPAAARDPGATIPLPAPQGKLDVAGLTLAPPGASSPVLKDVGFHIAPGQALGVIGASGAGKTALARAIVGHWPSPPGSIRLDGAPPYHLCAGNLGVIFGYLPQATCLFDGTVAQNIARLDPAANPADILAAAHLAGAHEMILRLPLGYDTPLTAPGLPLSGGQARRIALARALYGDPPLLVLDEPEAHLDAEGAAALCQTLAALKARGRAILVMSHRPLAIAVLDHLIVLDAGRVALRGPRDLVLRRLLQAAPSVPRAPLAEGAA